MNSIDGSFGNAASMAVHKGMEGFVIFKTVKKE